MKSEHGSAIVYVFIGIALFGALMFMFSRGGSQSSNNLSSQQAKIVATEIITYSRTVESAVQKLLSKGCSENEISFENSIVAGYTNPKSPPDKSCHVFQANGGKVKWQTPPPSIHTPDGQYIFTNSSLGLVGTGVGVNGVDLVIVLRNLPVSVCKQVNTLLNVKKVASRTADSNGIPIEDNNPNLTYNLPTPVGRFFIGDFNYANFIGDTESASAKDTFRCIKDDDSPEYYFIGALYVR